MSYTALLTNLANRVQPIIRYDLGDRILIDTRDCPCGSPLPVLRIEGRTDEVLRLKTASGAVVDLPPVALATVIEECAGTHPFQVVQSGPQTLELRFENGTGERYARTSRRALRVYLDMQGLTNVAITGARRPLIVNARSGKLQRVLARQ
jgi:phenylacetate-coenzyme A ligase PaaK-like adenylate-forming protein